MRRVWPVLLVVGCGGGGQPINDIHSSLSVDRIAAVAGVDSVAVTVIVEDQHGPVAGQHVELVVTGSENMLDPPAGDTDADGRFTATWTSFKAELKAISDSLDAMTVQEVAFLPGVAALLEFVAPPLGGGVGEVLPEIAVGVFDAYGNPAPHSNSYPVTLTLLNSSVPVNGQTTAIPNDEAVAVFDDVHIDTPGTLYFMVASATGLTDATSASFTIVAPP